jgi:hypothetical protein
MDAQGHWLARVVANHETLRAQAAAASPDVSGVIHLALAVIAYGFIEERWLFPARPLVDPLVVAELRREHERIAEDVDLLRSLCGAGEDPADRGAVSASLLARLRTHVEREERIVYEPLRRTAASAG